MSAPLNSLIWIPDDEDVFIKAVVVTEDHPQIIRLENGTEITLPEGFHPANDTADDVTKLTDLTKLTHLNQATLLSCVEERFYEDCIYTWTGPIQIAVNPFKTIRGLYEESTLNRFIDKCFKDSFDTDREPHVYSIAEVAYRNIVTSRKCQSILVSGESGAGKTETTKHVMKLLATAGASGVTGTEPSVEHKVLQSNPLLEAFGNAKTLRNDNSSRFGKFIEMQFNIVPSETAANGGYKGTIVGARVHTYLLETVRVCRQLKGERNYHSFYQLAAALDAAKDHGGKITITTEKARQLRAPIAEDLTYDFSELVNALTTEDGCDTLNISHYTTQSECTIVDTIDDFREFMATCLAMTAVGMSAETQKTIWGLVAAVLLVGGVQINGIGSDASEALIDDNFATLSSLLGVQAADLQRCLTSKTLKVGVQNIKKQLKHSDALDTRDSLARHIYHNIFQRIVTDTNRSFGNVTNFDVFTGVLDIFGFECFQTNSFEQLCINFTNEKLQMYFNSFIFRYEQTLYEKEGIMWNALDFPDNSDCVDMLAKPRDGVFAMLDEECIVPQGSDKGYSNKLRAAKKDHVRFGFSKTKPDIFIVNHFAGPVEYNTTGFLDKNKELLSTDILSIMTSSKHAFVSEIFNAAEERKTAKSTGKSTKKMVTVSGEFVAQLNELMETVEKTDPHFIRCIKPNPQNRSDAFDRTTVNLQLGYGGVLEAVKVSRAGYPVRQAHDVFWKNYKCLLPRDFRLTIAGLAEAERSTQMLQKLNDVYMIPPDRHGGNAWAVGKTMVFLKHDAFTIISVKYASKQNASVMRIQASFRGCRVRAMYRNTMDAIRIIQRNVRAGQARVLYRAMREENAAKNINRCLRGWFVRSKTRRQRRAIVRLQSISRGRAARVFTKDIVQNRAASKIQISWKRFAAVSAYQKKLSIVRAVQKRFRVREAKRKLAHLRADARSTKAVADKLTNTMNEKKELEMQLAGEQIRITELESRIAASAIVVEEAKKSISELDELKKQFAAIQSELITARSEIETLSASRTIMSESLSSMENELSNTRQTVAEKESAILAASEETESLKAMVAELNQSNSTLQSQKRDLETALEHAAAAGDADRNALMMLRQEYQSLLANGVNANSRSSTPYQENVSDAIAARSLQTPSPLAPSAPTISTVDVDSPHSLPVEGDSEFDSKPKLDQSAYLCALETASSAPSAAVSRPTTTTSELNVPGSTDSSVLVQVPSINDILLNMQSSVVSTSNRIDDSLAAISPEKLSSELSSLLTVANAALSVSSFPIDTILFVTNDFREAATLLTQADPHGLQQAFVNWTDDNYRVIQYLKDSPTDSAMSSSVNKTSGQIDLTNRLLQLKVSEINSYPVHMAVVSYAEIEDLSTCNDSSVRNCKYAFLCHGDTPFLRGDVQRISITNGPIYIKSEHDGLYVREYTYEGLRNHGTYQNLPKSHHQTARSLTDSIVDTNESKPFDDAEYSCNHCGDMSRLDRDTYNYLRTNTSKEAAENYRHVRVPHSRRVVMRCISSGEAALIDRHKIPVGLYDSFLATVEPKHLFLALVRVVIQSNTRKYDIYDDIAAINKKTKDLKDELPKILSCYTEVVAHQGAVKSIPRGLLAPRKGPLTLTDVITPSSDPSLTPSETGLQLWGEALNARKEPYSVISFAPRWMSRDFHVFAAATKTGVIDIFKVKMVDSEFEELKKEKSDRGCGDSCDCPDHKYIRTPLVKGGDEKFYVCPNENVEHVRTLWGHQRAVTSISWGHTREVMLTSSFDGAVRFWDLRYGFCTKIFNDSTPIYNVLALPDKDRFIVSNRRKLARTVEMEDGTVVQRLRSPQTIRCFTAETIGGGILAGTDNGAIIALERKDDDEWVVNGNINISDGKMCIITSLSYVPSTPPTVIATCSDDSAVVVRCQFGAANCGIANFKVIERIPIKTGALPMSSCLIRPPTATHSSVRDSDSYTVLVPNADGSVKIISSDGTKWQGYTNAPSKSQKPLISVSVTSNNAVMATCGSDGKVCIYRNIQASN